MLLETCFLTLPPSYISWLFCCFALPCFSLIRHQVQLALPIYLRVWSIYWNSLSARMYTNTHTTHHTSHTTNHTPHTHIHCAGPQALLSLCWNSDWLNPGQATTHSSRVCECSDPVVLKSVSLCFSLISCSHTLSAASSVVEPHPWPRKEVPLWGIDAPCGHAQHRPPVLCTWTTCDSDQLWELHCLQAV